VRGGFVGISNFNAATFCQYGANCRWARGKLASREPEVALVKSSCIREKIGMRIVEVRELKYETFIAQAR
jgi:hypothetical protein